MANQQNKFLAAQQGLGYIYQIRFGLLKILELPEDTKCFIEKDDDLDFDNGDEGKILASLKHKAPGDTLSDLSIDFWKSVRIWIQHFKGDRSADSPSRYFLFTTGSVAKGSYLENFLNGASLDPEIVKLSDEVLSGTESQIILKIKNEFDDLDEEDKVLFLARIAIFDQQVRIVEIPEKVMSRYMRSTRPKFRKAVYQRLEGWWNDVAISLMDGKRVEPASGIEVSEMLHRFCDEFRDDNLPIDFRHATPPEGADPHNDPRLFVEQLRVLGVNQERIKRAILDYYRAFEQRGSWAREHVTITGEVDEYDDRLVDEWDRMKNILWGKVDDGSQENELQNAGKELLNWFETNDQEKLRIRPQVTEQYVMMGSYHMLANEEAPRIHWHPQFLSRLSEILTKGSE